MIISHQRLQLTLCSDHNRGRVRRRPYGVKGHDGDRILSIHFQILDFVKSNISRMYVNVLVIFRVFSLVSDLECLRKSPIKSWNVQLCDSFSRKFVFHVIVTYTLWKSRNSSLTEILREINIGKVTISKVAIFTVLESPTFCKLEYYEITK